MKNKPAALFSAILIGLLLLTACKSGKRQSLTIPFILVQLGLSETAYNYSGVVVNNIADRDFTITNIGNKDGLQVSGFTSNAAAFTIISENCTTQSLNQGASCSFTVRFAPTAQGSYNGSISIASNFILPSSVAVSGEGYGLNVWIGKADFTTCTAVKVDVSVTDTSGAVKSLSKGNFALWQNILPRTITSSPAWDDSDKHSVVLSMDLSSSLTSAINNIKSDSKDFIDLLGTNDEAAIYKFKRDIIHNPDSFLPILTGKTTLKNYIDSPDPTDEGTALYDTVFDSVTLAASGSNEIKTVIVLSDGDDLNSTNHTLQDVISHAKALNVPIFTIYYVDPASAPNAEPSIMHQIAVETGGQDYYTNTATIDIASIFAKIRDTLGSKYTIQFDATPFCSGSIPLQVRVDNGGLYGIDTRTFIVP